MRNIQISYILCAKKNFLVRIFFMRKFIPHPGVRSVITHPPYKCLFMSRIYVINLIGKNRVCIT